MKINILGVAALVLLGCVSLASAQNYTVLQTEIFRPQNKKVLLLKESRGQKRIILFRTNLRVNTDGSPLSYHPQDPDGKREALNSICNGIAVTKVNSTENLCLKRSTYREAIGVFQRFRDSNYQTVPQGYRIKWENVLAKDKTENGKVIPCIFKSEPFRGYFGSLTALKNGLTRNTGECEINNQVNPMRVPALVLVGGENVVKNFGAKVGDLLVAYNPKKQLFSSAIIGDTGPDDNLGEGSILLNMKLSGKTNVPTNRTETYALSIEDAQVLIAIIPSSRLFQIQGNRPYTAENINQRVGNWLGESGFNSSEKFIELMKSFQSRL